MADNKNMGQYDELTAFLDTIKLWVTDSSSGSPLLKWIGGETLMRGYSDFKLLKNQSANPASPANGYVGMFARDGKVYLIDESESVTELGSGSVGPGLADLRLSLSSADPEADNLAEKNILYVVPYRGNEISLYDSAADVYELFQQPSEFYIHSKSTDRTGDTLNGSNQITNFSGNWRHIAVGYEITGVNIPAGTTVTAIDFEANTITMSAAAIADGTGVLLTLAAPADSRWDVFAFSDGADVELSILKWTDLGTRATALTYGAGHYYLSGNQKLKYLGNFTVTAIDGELEFSPDFRGVENQNPVAGGQYLLDKASGISLLGGYMSAADKQAASWTITKSGGNWDTPANMYDGNDSSAMSFWVQNTATIYATVDFGGDVVLDEITVRLSTSASYRPDNVYIYYSPDGTFGGEETLVGSTTSGASATEHTFSFSPIQARYWRFKIWGNSGDMGQISEFKLHYGGTLGLVGVPFGSKVELWDGSSLVESQISDNILKPTYVEFTAAVTSVDKITITRPDGSTTWLEFAMEPDSGNVYILYLDK